MSGDKIKEEAVLAAVKPLKNLEISAADQRSSVASAKAAGTATWSQGMTGTDTKSPATQNLEALFQVHHDRVFRTAYRVTGSVADAEDVLQTVFLRVARGQETAETAENPAAYFARAAINAS